MAVGKDIETRGHVTGFREEIARAAEAGEDAFFTWFDSAADKDAAFLRGEWDFALHIAAAVAPYLNTPEDKTALEIGHGGGRILAAASRYFCQVVGVDIHEHNARVEEELCARGVTNAILHRADGNHLPVENASVDLVYSFVVLQHVETMRVFEQYVAETARVLKPGGVAVLYFGRRAKYSSGRSERWRYWLDCLCERWWLPQGFEELPAQVNCVNLRVTLQHAMALARRLGMDVVHTAVSRKKVPDGVHQFGGQHGLVLRKRG